MYVRDKNNARFVGHKGPARVCTSAILLERRRRWWWSSEVRRVRVRVHLLHHYGKTIFRFTDAKFPYVTHAGTRASRP